MKTHINYLLWLCFSTLWATISFVVPDFMDNPIGNLQAFLLVSIYVISVGIFHFFILAILSINRYVCVSVLPIYALLGAICSYYRYVFHVSITPLLIDAVIHTNTHEAAGVISIGLILWIILNLSISILFCILRFRKIVIHIHWGYVVLSIVLMIAYYFAIPRLKTALDTRFPLNIVLSIEEYICTYNHSSANRIYPSINQSNTPDSLMVIAILGEACRADHMQLNGYPRETNPKLSKTQNIVSLSNIYSQYTYTTGSVPHIVTRADSIHTEYAYTEHSFVSLFHNEGFYTLWLSNESQLTPLLDFMHESDTIIYTPTALIQPLYAKWLDEELLPLMDLFIGHSPKQLYVLHTMGSHWLYDCHTSNELSVFQPAISNRDVRQNTQEQLINSYDNTIVYLDAFIDSIIQRIDNKPAIILYLSDHGESLGEEGRYLHAIEDAEEEKYPAALVWYSDKYAQLYPEKIKALIANKDKRYRTDYLFYSILYAAGIEAEGDNPQVNIFKTATP